MPKFKITFEIPKVEHIIEAKDSDEALDKYIWGEMHNDCPMDLHEFITAKRVKK